MAKIAFIAVPLLKLEHTSTGFTSRELEIMSANQIRRVFEASSVDEIGKKLDEICAEIGKDTSKSWNAWVGMVRGERAPRGFKVADAARAFNRDINPERVTVGKPAVAA
jgi:hypothetical protein